MGGAMFLITVLASVLIVAPSMLWLFVAYGALIAVVAAVWVFLTRFIDADEH
jgi:hypothetical protein